jgi:hypothetical protein
LPVPHRLVATLIARPESVKSKLGRALLEPGSSCDGQVGEQMIAARSTGRDRGLDRLLRGGA